MNFWERKGAYQSGWIDKKTFEKQRVTDLIHGEYIYRDLNGIEKPIILKDVTIENSFSATAVIIKGHNKKMPYKDMVKEIDRMLNTNNSMWNGNPIALHGIPLEDYTTKDLYDELIKTLGAKA